MMWFKIFLTWICLSYFTNTLRSYLTWLINWHFENIAHNETQNDATLRLSASRHSFWRHLRHKQLASQWKKFFHLSTCKTHTYTTVPLGWGLSSGLTPFLEDWERLRRSVEGACLVQAYDQRHNIVPPVRHDRSASQSSYPVQVAGGARDWNPKKLAFKNTPSKQLGQQDFYKSFFS